MEDIEPSKCRVFKLRLSELAPVLMGRGRIASLPADARIIDVRDAGMECGRGVDILVSSSEFGPTAEGQCYPIATAEVIVELK